MKRILLFITLTVFVVIVCTTGCSHKQQVKPVIANGNYPDSIANIIINKCTYSGCHNQASYINAGDLLLDSWEHMFQGGISGAVMVAYNTTYSPLLYYCNPDTTAVPKINDPGHFGSHAAPTAADYKTLVNWVARGAPDRNGNIPFATNAATRQKLYIENAGCNLVGVIDGASKLIMRYIPVGTYPGSEVLHDIKVSGDGNYAYISFYNGSMLQKIDTRTDTVTGYVNINNRTYAGASGQWSVLYLSPTDTALMVSGYQGNGYLEAVNTAAMQVIPNLCVDAFTTGANSGLLTWPHGITANAAFDTFFVALQYGNMVQKIRCNSHNGFCPQAISIDHNPPVATSNATTPDPHQLKMAPDYSKYFVTCQNTNEVRVMDAHADTLIKVIPVGYFPQEMALCVSKNYLFVACMLDSVHSAPQRLGTVYVLEYNNYNVVKVLNGDFYEPHDMAVDNQDGLLYIASRNNYNGGIPAHHCTATGCKAGWYTVYDLNTLMPADSKRYEVASDPYSIAPRY